MATTAKSRDIYLMESDAEADRIDFKTDLETTRNQLLISGCKEGMAAIDIGCASGAVTREISKIVKSGCVVGMDLSQDRIEWAKKASLKTGFNNISFRSGSIYETGIPSDQFDYIWSRFLFEYLKKPVDALTELKRICKEGGKVVVGDLDYNCLNIYPFPQHLKEKWEKGFSFASQRGLFDPYVGRKLYKMFKDLNFRNILVHPFYHHFYVGGMPTKDLKNWEQKLNAFGDFKEHIFSDPSEYDEFCSEMIKLWTAPDTFIYSSLFLVSGEK